MFDALSRPVTTFEADCFAGIRSHLHTIKFAVWASRKGGYFVKDQDTFNPYRTRHFATELEAVVWANRAYRFKVGEAIDI